MPASHPCPSQSLTNIYARLRNHFDYAERWWPGSPLQITLTAILVQQCDWSTAWQAVGKLGDSGLLSLPRLALADTNSVKDQIAGVSFAPTKAVRIVRLARALLDRGFETIEAFLDVSRGTSVVRSELLALDGIGPETADAILLYASEHPTFIIDEYTRRIFRRLGAPPHDGEATWDQPYDQLKKFFEDHVLADLARYHSFSFAPDVPLPVALLRDWHAQLVELGKHHCLRTNPRCDTGGRECWNDFAVGEGHCTECTACPLREICATGRSGS